MNPLDFLTNETESAPITSLPKKVQPSSLEEFVQSQMNDDGTMPSGMVARRIGEEGERLGTVKPSDAGLGKEIVRGFELGLLQFVRSKANTFGLDDLKRKVDYELATNQQLFDAPSKSILSNIANRGAAGLGAVAPDLAVGAIASLATGGLGGGAALASTVGKVATGASMAAGMWGDNRDRLAQEMPDVDEATRTGLNALLTPAQTALFLTIGPHGKTMDSVAVGLALRKGLQAADEGMVKSLGVASLGSLKAFRNGFAQNLGAGVTASVAAEAAHDIGIAMFDPKMSDDKFESMLAKYPKLVLDSAIDMIGIAALPSTINAMTAYRAHSFLRDIAAKAPKIEEAVDADPTKPTAPGQAVAINIDLRAKTDQTFKDFEATLPQSVKGSWKKGEHEYSPIVTLIRNLSYKMAFAEKQADPVKAASVRPEKYIQDLSLLVINNPKHVAELQRLASNERAQVEYINQNIPDLASRLHVVSEQMQIRELKSTLDGFRALINEKVGVITEAQKNAVAGDISKRLSRTGLAKEGVATHIPARFLADSLGGADLARALYVDGEVRGIQIEGKKYALRLDRNFDGWLMPEEALLSREALRAEAEKAITDKSIFSSSKTRAELTNLKTETLSMHEKMIRAELFDKRFPGAVESAKNENKRQAGYDAARIKTKEERAKAKAEEDAARAAVEQAKTEEERKANKASLDVMLKMRQEAEGTGNEAPLLSAQEKSGDMIGQYNRLGQLMMFYAGHDPSTTIHEWFHHLWENDLMPDSISRSLHDAYAVKVPGREDDFPVAAKENAANAFAQYVLDGKLPENAQAAEAFNYMKGVLSAHWGEMKTFMQSGEKAVAVDERLVVPDAVKAKFDEVLGDVTHDVEAKLFGAALTDSMKAGEVSGPVFVSEKSMRDTAARVAQAQGITIDQAIFNKLAENAQAFGNKQRVQDLTPDQLYVLQHQLRFDATKNQEPLAQMKPSSEQDARYLELAKDPEKNKAELQKMVDEAAKKAGYNIGPVWHFTQKGGFTEFWTQSHFGSKEQADAIRERKGAIRGKKGLAGKDSIEFGNNDQYYRVFLNFKNPKRVEDFGDMYSWSDAAKKAMDEGYDGFVYKNSEEGGGDSFMIFDQNQVKSADPITRDFSGNVIPLSKRFNNESNSILESRTWSKSDISMLDEGAVRKRIVSAFGGGEEGANKARQRAIEMFGEDYATMEGDQLHVLTALNKRQLMQLLGEVEVRSEKAEIPGLEKEVLDTVADLNKNSADRTEFRKGGPLWNKLVANAKNAAKYGVRRGLSRLYDYFTLSEDISKGDPNAPLYKQAREVFDAENAKKPDLDALYAKTYRFMIENEIPLSDIMKRVDVAGDSFRNEDVIGMYLASDYGTNLKRNDVKKMKESWSGRLTDAHFKDAIKIVKENPWMDKLAHFMSDTSTEYFDRLLPVYEANTGKKLGKVEGAYLTHSFEDGSIMDIDPLHVLENQGGIADHLQTKTPTGERGKEAGTRMRMGAFNSFIHHASAMINYIHKADVIRKNMSVLSDERVVSAMDAQYGDRLYATSMKDLLARELSPSGKLATERMGDNFFRWINANAANAFLPWSFGPVASQPISILTGMGTLTGWNVPRFAADAVMHILKLPLAAFEAYRSGKKGSAIDVFMQTPDAQFMLKHAPAAIETLKSNAEMQIKQSAAHGGINEVRFGKFLLSKIKDTGLIPMYLVDASIRVSLFKTVFNAKLEQFQKAGKVGAEAESMAAYEAARAIRKSSNPSMSGERGLFQTETGEYFKGSLLFTTAPIAQLKFLINDTMKPFFSAVLNGGVKGGAKLLPQTLWRLSAGALLPGLALGMLSRRRLQESKEEVLRDAFVGGIISTIPIIGQAIWMSAVFGMGREGKTDVGSVWEDVVGKTITSLQKVTSLKGDFRDAKQIVDACNFFTGTPRAWSKFLMDMYDQMEVNGKPLSEALPVAMGAKRPE